jgi:single-strand DNA-binding protein
MINSLTIVGRLGQDPEIKYFDSGSVKARFSVAVDRPSKDKTTDWFNIEVWGKTAEFVGEWIKKGQLVSVQGSIEINQWTDQTGNVRETPLVRGSAVGFVGSKRDNQQYPQNQGGGGGSYNTDQTVPF